MLTSEAAQVFHHDAGDLPGINVVHHPLKGRTLKVGSAPAIVHVFINNVQLLLLGEFAQDGPLCFDGNAVAEAFVVTAESHI